VEKTREPGKRARQSESWAWTGFADKTLWDWLQLLSALAIPVVLAAAGFWFTTQQETHQQAIEEKRAQAEQELEEQRAQDAALQAFLDQMGSCCSRKI
jgi:serine phosphatase RsbU (regulator of sigma subunit)